MYRPPGEPVKELLNSIESSLNKVQAGKNKCFILGDFNIDLLNPSTLSKNLLDTLYSYSFCPLISKPTWITKQSATLLDNIFTNCLENVLQSGIFTSDISDHFAIFCTTNTDTKGYNHTHFKRKIHVVRYHVTRIKSEIIKAQKARKTLGKPNWAYSFLAFNLPPLFFLLTMK